MTRAKPSRRTRPRMKRRVPDHGSVLDADDQALFQQLPELERPTSSVRRPSSRIMAATDNASCIVSLLPHVSDSARLHAPAAMNLCRTAMESAAHRHDLESADAKPDFSARLH